MDRGFRLLYPSFEVLFRQARSHVWGRAQDVGKVILLDDNIALGKCARSFMR